MANLRSTRIWGSALLTCFAAAVVIPAPSAEHLLITQPAIQGTHGATA